jgi:hypothetical protein
MTLSVTGSDWQNWWHPGWGREYRKAFFTVYGSETFVKTHLGICSIVSKSVCFLRLAAFLLVNILEITWQIAFGCERPIRHSDGYIKVASKIFRPGNLNTLSLIRNIRPYLRIYLKLWNSKNCSRKSAPRNIIWLLFKILCSGTACNWWYSSYHIKFNCFFYQQTQLTTACSWASLPKPSEPF